MTEENQNFEYENIYEDEIIETIDEHGHHVKFELIDIIELDGTEYGLLNPVLEGDEKPDNDEENDKIVVMRLIKDGEEFIFEKIEDDEEFNKVVKFVEEISQTEDLNGEA